MVQVLTKAARYFGLRLNITDTAWGRKTHQGAIPSLGGVAIALAFFLPVYALLLWDNDLSALWKDRPEHAKALFFGGAAIIILGLWDDIKGLRARYKLLGQTAVAVAVYLIGVQIHVINLPFVGELDMGIFSN